MAMNETIVRMNRIFENVLGCTLEFQAAEELSLGLWSSGDLADCRSNRPGLPQYVESLQADSFGFPVNHENQFAGFVVVHGMKEARPKKLIIMAELVSMVLEYGLKQEDRRERLRLIEERLFLMDESTKSNSNIIPLRPARFEKVLEVTEMDFETEVPASPLITMPLLLQVDPTFPLHRVALEIHNMSRRWAFLSLTDLPSDILSSKENLQQLGGITLFIPDLAKLSTEQQIRLAEYLAMKPTDDAPQVVAGVVEQVEQLELSGRLMAHLTEHFMISKLEFTSKSSQQVTSDLIEASLQHICDQMRETHAIGDHVVPFHIQYFQTEETGVVH
ncbi:MAG: hypothetical protein V4760_00745 [Bdellovibrionota bacterium]